MARMVIISKRAWKRPGYSFIGIVLMAAVKTGASSTNSASRISLARSSNWLAAAKLRYLEAAEAKRGAVIATGRVIGAKIYQIDDASFSKLQAYWNNNVWPIAWVTMDDTTVSLTQSQFQAGAQNVLQYVRAIRLNYNALKYSIRGATSVAQLGAIDIAGGWPANP